MSHTLASILIKIATDLVLSKYKQVSRKEEKPKNVMACLLLDELGRLTILSQCSYHYPTVSIVERDNANRWRAEPFNSPNAMCD